MCVCEHRQLCLNAKIYTFQVLYISSEDIKQKQNEKNISQQKSNATL